MEELKLFIKRENENMKDELLSELLKQNHNRFVELEKAVAFAQDNIEEQKQKTEEANKLAHRATTALEESIQRLDRVEEELEQLKQASQLDWLVFSGKPSRGTVSEKTWRISSQTCSPTSWISG